MAKANRCTIFFARNDNIAGLEDREWKPYSTLKASIRATDQLLDWSWKAGLKVQQLGPERRVHTL